MVLTRVQTLTVDLINPSQEQQQRCHKLKRLVQSPNSFFMDVKCPGCFAITTVFSHAQSVVLCGSCAQVLAQPTGGKARLAVGAYCVCVAVSDVSRLLFPSQGVTFDRFTSPQLLYEHTCCGRYHCVVRIYDLADVSQNSLRRRHSMTLQPPCNGLARNRIQSSALGVSRT